MKSSAELRAAFLEFFSARGHEVVRSSPLVPANDPTLLFTNAGMVQFKETFLGIETRECLRAASSQRCVRAGGKHNDLENVGYTARHHTFFEMLGNFSFGDYFKQDAIHFAWEFLTVTLSIDPSRLWVTVYKDDDEAASIWLDQVGVSPDRFSRIGDKGGKRYESDNFWSMGDTGPCGPCSEIFYDHGEQVAGGPPGSLDEDGDRYIEIWNLVFMQYNRDSSGELMPLPRPSVDTGMGLERLAAVMQGVHSNYEIDLFVELLHAVQSLIPEDVAVEHPSLRVIADHIRSCAFLVTDGVMPSNEGRGYVLRRIIRRAIRHGYKLGMQELFFNRLVAPLCRVMGEAYPELIERREQVEHILLVEEERFAETLNQGMKILEEKISALDEEGMIDGALLFLLYDTYGFPVDLTADIARERNLAVDMDGFEREMGAQRERARAASAFSAASETVEWEGEFEFTGYESTESECVVVALQANGVRRERLEEGEQAVILLDRTPFYAESGGQIGDRGIIVTTTGSFEVAETRKQGGLHLHHGRVAAGSIILGDRAAAQVDYSLRQAIRLNHTATHLLHAALRSVLGEHVVQKGSLVDAERLRFDFAHYEPVRPEQLHEIERMVNEQIRLNHQVETSLMAYDDALEAGAMALFGEKYGNEVRVLSVGTFSVELCGGTHASRSGDIGLFRITAESGVASGVRRMEAVTAESALDLVDRDAASLGGIATLLRSDSTSAQERVRQMVERLRELERELEQIKGKMAASKGDSLIDQAVEIDGIKVLAARVDGQDNKAMRETLDRLRDRLVRAVVVLAAVEDGKVRLVAGVSKSETGRIAAGELVNMVATQVGGKGGGRADMAQAGGSDPARLDEALAGVTEWVRARLM